MKKALIGEPTINQVIAGGRRKVHYLYTDESEMVEEFDINSNECLLRKVKKHKDFGTSEWEYEIGHPIDVNFNPETDILAPSSKNPIFTRKDTEARFEWRIRNLVYPKEVYSVEVDHNKQEIVLRTSNKKYFKRFCISDLKRAGIKLEARLLDIEYANNTLVVSYSKPEEILKEERKIYQDIIRII